MLTLHLKRFVFDYQTMRRRKVNDPLRVGSSLDLKPFLSEEAAADTAGREMVYELYAILIHSGSAMGGHYHAYVKDTVTSAAVQGGDASAGWCDYNDSQVTPIDLMTLERMMGGTATAATEEEGEAAAPPEPEGAAAAAAPGVESWSGGSASNAYMLVYRRRDAQGEPAPSGTDMTELLAPETQADIASEGYGLTPLSTTLGLSHL